MWKLVIEDDAGKRTNVPLTRDDYTLGRREGNTIRLTERNVSREHGCVRRGSPGRPADTAGGESGAEEEFFLEDRSSYNGLFVNGVRVVESQVLQHGDLIQIGDYRIVLQNDAALASDAAAIPVTSTDPGYDAKATIPMAAGFRGQSLTERPSRFVMLVGPTPGVEYPLDRERLTIGRAEESTISVNHNSVSRLHCEVHALGDGRYEIVDKGSSNGVRVNAVELKRSIIEAGDVIELGDVRFKFVGAGQVFVPGPNESQQLTAISDREAELADGRQREWGGYALPILSAGIVGALIILVFMYVLRGRIGADTEIPLAAPADVEQLALLDAKRACTAEECEAYQDLLARVPVKSPWRSHADFKLVENLWAESMLKKASAAPDITTKRALLTRIATAGTLDEIRRAELALAISELDQAVTATIPMSSSPATVFAVAPTGTAASPATVRSSQTAHAAASAAPVVATSTSVATPTTPAPKSTGPTALEKAKEAALEGRSSEVRRLLETRVRGGHASPEEVQLVRKACSVPFDKACVEDVKSKYP